MHNSTVSRSPHMPTATATLRLSGILQQRVYSEMLFDGSGKAYAEDIPFNARRPFLYARAFHVLT